jgi:hypothetical protein
VSGWIDQLDGQESHDVGDSGIADFIQPYLGTDCAPAESDAMLFA